MEIIQVAWTDARAFLHSIRQQVFVAEQGLSADLAIDDHDAICWHWLAYENGQPVATVRMRHNGEIGRMAVLADYRRRGTGSALLETCLQHARIKQVLRLTLSAAQETVPFYEKFGFIAEGEAYLDDGVVCQAMYRNEEKSLGFSRHKFVVGDDAAERIAEMCATAQRQIRIFSEHLEPAYFASDELSRILSAMARRHRNSEIRLLLCDDRPLRETHHPLVSLAQRLPSSVAIRLVEAPEKITHRDYYVLADRRGILVYRQAGLEQGWGSLDLPPAVRDYTEQFDLRWHRSRPSPWLLRLS